MPLTDPEYEAHDAVGLAELVRQREVTPGELLELALARTARLNPRLGAIVRTRDDDARREAAALETSAETSARAAGPSFEGVPFLVKDLDAAIAGAPLGGGSRFFADHRPSHDAEIVRRFRRAGLVLFGHTATPELGITPYTEPEVGPPARNPWDLGRTPGGSSGGSAAAVAGGIVPAAHGSDGGGFDPHSRFVLRAFRAEADAWTDAGGPERQPSLERFRHRSRPHTNGARQRGAARRHRRSRADVALLGPARGRPLP